MRHRRFSAGLVVVLLALTAPAASAKKFQMPLPPHWPSIVVGACPTGAAGPCAVEGSLCSTPAGCIFFASTADAEDRWTRAHELGHIFDSQVLTDPDRAWFLPLLRGKSRSGALQSGAPWWSATAGSLTGSERFADAYANCALSLTPRGEWWTTEYGYMPSARVHRKVCQTIRWLGRSYPPA